MSSYRNWTGFAAAAALAAAVGVAGTPAQALLNMNALVSNALTNNALSANALTAQGSALADLNGVAVEAVTPPQTSAPQQERVAGIIIVDHGDDYYGW
jgi:hypothetical protein